jgi:hypothetical protein
MPKKIKLLWDFRGPEAKKIAEHHCIHLKEYAVLEKLEGIEIDITKVSDLYTIAFMIVEEKDMQSSREALKPHRGQLAK